VFISRTHVAEDGAANEKNLRLAEQDCTVAEVEYVHIESSGLKPMPRRDHNAILIKNNSIMLVYGGRNDNLHTSSNPQTAKVNLSP
jgi:hypothetical protein